MTRFRPCIDLHDGQVKQIVGGSLRDDGAGPQTNFVSDRDAAWYADRYRRDGLAGAHVIKLGPGNDAAARAALAAWPDGLQLGGGIDADNAPAWIEAGAAQVIVTSWLFPDGDLDRERLRRLSAAVGPQRLVIDLSCRRQGDRWFVATRRWQDISSVALGPELFAELADHCCEFLVHAADVEGLCRGIDDELVSALGSWSTLPCTYAGGGRTLDDLALVERLSDGRVDLTIGSALDIFGGDGVRYADCLTWNHNHPRER